MKNMRKFYENWIVLDSNSAIAIAELQSEDYQIDIYRSLSVDNVVDFPYRKGKGLSDSYNVFCTFNTHYSAGVL